jgi:hypothetical protein
MPNVINKYITLVMPPKRNNLPDKLVCNNNSNACLYFTDETSIYELLSGSFESEALEMGKPSNKLVELLNILYGDTKTKPETNPPFLKEIEGKLLMK